MFVHGLQNTKQWFLFWINRLTGQKIGFKVSQQETGGFGSVRSGVKLRKGVPPSRVGADEPACCPLEDEGQDGGAQRGVIAELLQVAAVLPLGPNGHLDEAHQREEGHRHALSHDREAEPGAQLQESQVSASAPEYTTRTEHTLYLVCIVWTGHQQEDPGEGVLGRVGDLSGFRTCVKTVKERKCRKGSSQSKTLMIGVRTWWAEIPQSNMDGKVANLAELRKQTSSVFSKNEK